MPIDPQAARLLRMLGTGPRGDAGPIGIDERRRSFDALMRLSGPAPAMAGIEDRSIPGPAGPLRLRIFRPPQAKTEVGPGLVYFHGGGLVAGSLETYDVLCRTLALASECRVLAADYRLAPEHPFPAAIEDAMAAAMAILDAPEAYGLDPHRIAIGGDSAGGTLAAIVTHARRDRGGNQPRCQLLLCPVLDFVEDYPSKQAFGDGFLLDAALMARDLADLAPTVPIDDPLVSPLRAVDLSGLPKALIHTAGFDPLRDEGRAYADRLAAGGVEVCYTCHEAMVHHFYGLGGIIPAARAIMSSIGWELASSLASAPLSR